MKKLLYSLLGLVTIWGVISGILLIFHRSPLTLGSFTSVIADPHTSPFDFQVIGNIKSNSIQERMSVGDLTVNILNVPTGSSGVVKSIQIIFLNNTGTDAVNNFATTTLKKVNLQIKYDGESAPTVNVPLASLFSYEAGNVIIVKGPFKTPFFTVTQPAPSLTTTNAAAQFSGILTYPIPYTNGINIDLVSQDSTRVPYWWVTTTYQDQLPNSWNRNLRFKVARSHGQTNSGANSAATTTSVTGNQMVGAVGSNFSAAQIGSAINFWDPTGVSIADEVIKSVENTTHLTFEDTPQHPPITAASFTNGDNSIRDYYIANKHTFLNLAVGKAGYVAAIYGFSHSTTTDTKAKFLLETTIRFYRDQENPASYQYSGMEDFFGSSFYYASSTQGDFGGLTAAPQLPYSGAAVNGVNDLNAYRLFKNEPLRYTNGIRGTLYNTYYNHVQFNWTTVYYEEM
jgi:hypothetical protein